MVSNYVLALFFHSKIFNGYIADFSIYVVLSIILEFFHAKVFYNEYLLTSVCIFNEIITVSKS